MKKKLSGAAKSSHLKRVVRSVKERVKNGCSVARAIAIEVNRSPYLAWGDVPVKKQQENDNEQ